MTTLFPRLSHDRYCDQIAAQATLLADHLDGADLALDVPSCPGWNLAQLTQHVGEELRWLDGMVRTRATAMADDTVMRDLSPTTGRTGTETGAWITDGAASLVDGLREAGPDAPMWTPLPDGTVSFFARRFAHETFMHRVDAAVTLEVPVTIDPDAGLDVLAEWMELGGLPVMLEFHPHRRALLGPGRTLRFTATDAEGPDATWLVDNRGEVMEHRPGPGEPGAVEVRGPVTSLVLFLYRRNDGADLEVTGDRALLDEWLAAVAFG
jgi:uncharacterized protein (TIGR03083 family)